MPGVVEGTRGVYIFLEVIKGMYIVTGPSFLPWFVMQESSRHRSRGIFTTTMTFGISIRPRENGCAWSRKTRVLQQEVGIE